MQEVRLAFQADPDYWEKQKLPTSGCFGFINGHLILGVAHHQLIMGKLLEKGWTWDDLMNAEQAWGWFVLEAYDKWPGGVTPAGKDLPFVSIRFTSDAGYQHEGAIEDCKIAFRNKYRLPVELQKGFTTKSIGDTGKEYGQGLAGKGQIDAYLDPDSYAYQNYKKFTDKWDLPDPPNGPKIVGNIKVGDQYEMGEGGPIYTVTKLDPPAMQTRDQDGAVQDYQIEHFQQWIEGGFMRKLESQTPAEQPQTAPQGTLAPEEFQVGDTFIFDHVPNMTYHVTAINGNVMTAKGINDAGVVTAPMAKLTVNGCKKFMEEGTVQYIPATPFDEAPPTPGGGTPPPKKSYKLSYEWDSDYWKEQDLPQSGCFGYVNGHLVLGVKHHQMIMGAFIDKGWTWAQLANAEQAWGWFGVTNRYGPTPYPEPLPDHEHTENTKYMPWINVSFSTDAGLQHEGAREGALIDFRKLYHLPAHQDHYLKSVEDKEVEYGTGLRGKNYIKHYEPGGAYYKDMLQGTQTDMIPEPPEDTSESTGVNVGDQFQMPEMWGGGPVQTVQAINGDQITLHSADGDEATYNLDHFKEWLANGMYEPVAPAEPTMVTPELGKGVKVFVRDDKNYHHETEGVIEKDLDEDGEYLIKFDSGEMAYMNHAFVKAMPQPEQTNKVEPNVPGGGNPPPKKDPVNSTSELPLQPGFALYNPVMNTYLPILSANQWTVTIDVNGVPNEWTTSTVQDWIKSGIYEVKQKTSKVASNAVKFLWGDGILEVTKPYGGIHHFTLMSSLVGKLGHEPQKYVGGTFAMDTFHPQFSNLKVSYSTGEGLPSPRELKEMLQRLLVTDNM